MDHRYLTPHARETLQVIGYGLAYTAVPAAIGLALAWLFGW